MLLLNKLELSTIYLIAYKNNIIKRLKEYFYTFKNILKLN